MKKEKLSETERKRGGLLWWSPLFLFLITAVAGMMLFRFYIQSLSGEYDSKEYEQYYVMITNAPKSAFWQSVYEGAYQTGLEYGIYVDFLNESMPKDYTRDDLMKVAVHSEVDGIIVEADESEELGELIHEAHLQGVPVVTLYSDNTSSERCSYVGVGGYNLGTEYGKRVLSIVKENPPREITNVVVLVNTNTKDSGQNIIFSGIQDTIKKGTVFGDIACSMVSVDATNAFAAEESIRDILMEEEIPDIIVCLNELNTTCVYQAVVDYNLVGEVSILGYYDSETIIRGIERNVIYATAAINTEQMGQYCVDALKEYHELGYTSQYFTADIDMVDRNNVNEYTEGGDDDE